MATVIDSFLVELGLDPSGLQAGVDGAQAELAKLRAAAIEAQNALTSSMGPHTREEMKRLQQAARDTQKAFDQAQKRIAQNFKETERQAAETAKKLKEHGESASEFFAQLTEKAVAFFAVMAGGLELKEFAEKTMDAQVKAGRLADILGVDVVELQAYGEAAKFSGGSVEGFGASVKALGEKLTVLGTKLRGAKMAGMALAQVGLSEVEVKDKNVFDVMGMLADKFEGMDKLKAMKMGGILGLDEATVLMLTKGRKGMEEMAGEMKELGIASKEDIES